MTPEEFQTSLTLYGSRLEKWPPMLALKGRAALRSDINLQRLMEEEARFEALLHAYNPTPSAGFCARIAARAAALPPAGRSPLTQLRGILDELCASLALPSPSLAFGALVVAGMALGFFANNLVASTADTERQETTAFSALFHMEEEQSL